MYLGAYEVTPKRATLETIGVLVFHRRGKNYIVVAVSVSVALIVLTIA